AIAISIRSLRAALKAAVLITAMAAPTRVSTVEHLAARRMTTATTDAPTHALIVEHLAAAPGVEARITATAAPTRPWIVCPSVVGPQAEAWTLATDAQIRVWTVAPLVGVRTGDPRTPSRHWI